MWLTTRQFNNYALGIVIIDVFCRLCSFFVNPFPSFCFHLNTSKNHHKIHKILQNINPQTSWGTLLDQCWKRPKDTVPVEMSCFHDYD